MTPTIRLHSKKIFFFFFCFFSTYYILLGQSDFQSQKDSLLRDLAGSEGKERIITYQSLAQLPYPIDQIDSSLHYYEKAIEEAQKQKDIHSEGILKAAYLGKLYNSNRPDLFQKEISSSLKFFEVNEQWSLYYNAYQLLLATYIEIGQMEEAIQKANLLYKRAKEKEHITGMAVATLTMGTAYRRLLRLEDAEKYYRETINLEKKDTTRRYSLIAHFEICEVFLMQERYDEALAETEEWEKVIDYLEKLIGNPNIDERINLYTLLALIYIEKEDPDKAEEHVDLVDKYITKDIQRYNMLQIRASIAFMREEYDKALDLCREVKKSCEGVDLLYHSALQILEIEILCKMRNSDDIFELFREFVLLNDSVMSQEAHAQLDELRTVYEVDKITSDKEKFRIYLVFVSIGCILLVIALGLWIYYSRMITQKNKTMVFQIKELQKEQELQKQSQKEDKIVLSDSEIPETRKNKLCVEIKNLLINDKIYHNPTLTRDEMILQLGTNKSLFIEAFQNCFGVSFSEQINNLRLKETLILLEQTDLTGEEISERVGFGTARTFYRQFKNKYSMSPADYRKISKEIKQPL